MKTAPLALLLVLALCWGGNARAAVERGAPPALAGLTPMVDLPEGRVQRLEFVAFDSRTAREPSFRLQAHPTVGFPRMGEINDYIDWINRTADGDVDDIDRYIGYSFGLEWQFAQNWHGGLAYHRMEADTDGTTHYMGTPLDFDLELTVDGVELYGRRTWPDLIGPVDLEALLGVGYYTSDYCETENGYRMSGDDGAFGFRAGVGLSAEVVRNVDVFAQAGYLWLTFDDYHGGGRDVRFVSPGQPKAEVDFSGFWVGMGLAWRF